jgi:hypothetical protein
LPATYHQLYIYFWGTPPLGWSTNLETRKFVAQSQIALALGLPPAVVHIYAQTVSGEVIIVASFILDSPPTCVLRRAPRPRRACICHGQGLHACPSTIRAE